MRPSGKIIMQIKLYGSLTVPSKHILTAIAMSYLSVHYGDNFYLYNVCYVMTRTLRYACFILTLGQAIKQLPCLYFGEMVPGMFQHYTSIGDL